MCPASAPSQPPPTPDERSIAIIAIGQAVTPTHDERGWPFFEEVRWLLAGGMESNAPRGEPPMERAPEESPQ